MFPLNSSRFFVQKWLLREKLCDFKKSDLNPTYQSKDIQFLRFGLRWVISTEQFTTITSKYENRQWYIDQFLTHLIDFFHSESYPSIYNTRIKQKKCPFLAVSLLEKITFWYPDLLASQRNGDPVYAHLYCLPDKIGTFTWTKLVTTPNFLSFVHCFIVKTIITHLSTILRWRIWAISCLIPSSITTFHWAVSHKCKITPTTIH